MSETLEPALPDELDAKAERLMRRVCELDLKIATAESCTGGMLAALLTDIQGCGHGFDRGFVTYSKAAKADQLGIDSELLNQNDAVSEPVARAMAEGALARSDADIAVGITGFAGPAGEGCEEGLVHFAVARRDGATKHRVERFGPLGRGPVRLKALEAMLDLIEQSLRER
ncbi:MAG TPA: CinA family protein [Sphingomicrobium sp.]|nr:CinA family protein [Sphingomicrobium sp.]